MLEKILIPVLVVALVGAGAWLARSLLLVRPRLRVSYKPGEGQSASGPAGMLEIRWAYNITLSNLSKYDALEIRVIKSTNPQLSKLPIDHLKGLDSASLDMQLTKNLDRDTVVKAHHDFHGELEPPELNEMALDLEYRNESGFRFYTVYRRVNGSQTNMYHFRSPPVTG
jgi:hypothetical protein